jgi:hypothetical protein
MENNLIDLAKLIFEGEPKSDYSIQLELENYNSLEDLFEVLLHIFVYGYKLKELDVSSISKLIPYFRSIGVNFHLETIPYSEYEFLTNPKYLQRYCVIGEACFKNYDLSNLQFILSRNYKTVEKIEEMNACYVNEIKNDFVNSFISFIRFDFKNSS